MITRFSALAIVAATLLTPCQSVSAEDVLRVGVSSNLNSLDPAKAKVGEEHLVNYLVFSGLTRIDHEMVAKSDLATSWVATDDLKTWTFELRQGVKFHQGQDFTAADVVSTIERVLAKETGSGARSAMLIVDAVDALDDYTVRFTLNTPYSGFPELLGERQLRITSKASLNVVATEPNGTGPFKFKKFEPGNRVDLVRNDNYYNGDQPKLDGVTFLIMPENAARVAALETGELDLIWNVPFEAIDQLKAKSDITVQSVPTASWDALVMNNAVAPFDDTRVRQAIALVIDKSRMTEVALFGNGSPTHSPIPPNHPFFNDEQAFPEVNLEKAKQLLAEAGYPDGFEIVLYVPTGRPTRERLGVVAQQMLAPIGIKADLQRVPWDKFVSEIEGHAAFYSDGFYARPTADTMTYPWYHSEGSWNTQFWNFKSAEVDKLLDAARKAKTPKEQAAYYKQFQAVVEQEVPGVVPYVVNAVNAFNDKVNGFRSHPMMILDLDNVALSN